MAFGRSRIRIIAFILCLAGSLGACTVGWTEVRTGSKQAGSPWQCPARVEFALSSGHTTNTYGAKPATEAQLAEVQAAYRGTVLELLAAKGCRLDGSGVGTLRIDVDDLQQVSALPQEWLTGLSFGLIPSWGVRPAEVTYAFSQGDRTAVFYVDDRRVNHLVLTPVFWLNFLLNRPQADFATAFENFRG